MRILRISYRVVALIVMLFVALFLMGVFAPNAKNGLVTQRQKNIRQWWLKKVVSIVGLKMNILGEIPKAGDASLWVSNHVSWLDIPVVGSAGVAFLSKTEVRKWPIIGWLGEKGGTVYIQRGGKNASQIASKSIAENINAGDSVLVFPEATTTDGTDVKRFHARIFAPALDHGLNVQPIALQYLDSERNTHPNVAWGDESFLSNVFQILGESSIHVQLRFLPKINAVEFSERKHLADQTYNLIRDIVKRN